MKYLFTVLFLASYTVVFAQTITGKVTDATTGESVAGATVKLLDTDKGTVTDTEGTFSLEGKGTLQISSVGYLSQKIKATGATPSIELMPDITQLQSVEAVAFAAPSVGLTLKYTIVLPEDYGKNTAKRYPVVYLLHGHTGNYTSWITYAGLPTELANAYDCLIVLPDGGNSWYVNWSGQTDGKPHRWENMLVQDLIPHVDRNFSTKADPTHRSLGGLSMGGFGALAVGLKNPQLFGFVASTAGAIDFCQNIKKEMARGTLDWNSPQLWSDGDRLIDVPGFNTQAERTPQGLVFSTAQKADEYDPYLLLNQTPPDSLPFVHIDCGTGDDFIKDAFRFVEQLKATTKRYSFLTFPGEHEVPYWEHSIRHTFRVMADFGFLKNPDNPKP